MQLFTVRSGDLLQKSDNVFCGVGDDSCMLCRDVRVILVTKCFKFADKRKEENK